MTRSPIELFWTARNRERVLVGLKILREVRMTIITLIIWGSFTILLPLKVRVKSIL